jgi:hypothetical protein
VGSDLAAGGCPAIVVVGSLPGLRLGHLAFWPVRDKREERESGPLSISWAGPVRRGKGGLFPPFLFSEMVIK